MNPTPSLAPELKACPFCGSAAIGGGRYAACENDQCQMSLRPLMLETWNTRAPILSSVSVAATPSDKEIWPVPTLGKSADWLVGQRKVCQDYLSHLNAMLPEICGSEGHQWDNTEGKPDHREEGYHEEGSGAFLSRGPFVVTHCVDIFVRTCTRCGVTQKQDAKPVAGYFENL